MAYIYLDDLKKILPGILDSWIDKDDESWEWIFQEIEQKCHVGKKKKDKKPKKKDIQNAMEIAIMAHRNDINELNDKVSKLNDICNAHTVRLDNIGRDISAAKSMAETAKQRTEVDYSKYSGKSDGKVSYSNPENKDCKSCKYYCGAYEHCVTCKEYEHWEAKENE